MIQGLGALRERYRVEQVLGRGSQKCVYLAHDQMLDRRVAIAEVPHVAESAANGDEERLHEARAMARIGDLPHVVSIYDVITGDDGFYIVSRYLPGGDLAQQLVTASHGVLPTRHAVRIGMHVALALQHAHEHGICHRDVKPGNVLLDARGDAYLGDFGTAGLVNGREGTGAGFGFYGTLLYMPPEQVWGAPVHPSCDMYALGCVLYEALTGAPPFVSDSAVEVLSMHESVRPAPPTERNPVVPIVLGDLVLKLLAKEPAERPTAREVAAALDGMLRTSVAARRAEGVEIEDAGVVRDDRRASGLATSMRPARADTIFVARREEITVFDQVLERAWAGEPSVVLLAGEAGIGKSRLVREMRGRAEAQGAVTLFGQGYEDVPLPYRPFVEALLPMVGRLSDLSPDDARLLRAFLHLEASTDAESIAAPEADRHRLFLALGRALAAFSSVRPLVLTIDDLHWVDRASLDLFEHVAFGLAHEGGREGQRLVLVGSFRPVGTDDRLGRAVDRIEREPPCKRIELGPFDDGAIYELLMALGVERPANQLVHTVREASRGNPLLIAEVLDALRRSGAIQQRRGFSVAVVKTDIEVPSSISSAIGRRLSELPAPCRQLLDLAALLGDRFNLDLLSAVGEKPPDDVVDQLEPAVSERLLYDDGETYQFAHPTVRQALLASTSTAKRQRLHRKIAAKLEENYARDPERILLRLAHHLIRSGPQADPEKVARFAQRAAEQAMASYAWHEAGQFLEAALEVGERTGVLALRELGELHTSAGHTYRHAYDSGPCIEHFDAAIAAFRECDDVKGLASALTGRAISLVNLGMSAHGRTDEAPPLEDVLARLPESQGRMRARLMGTLADLYFVANQGERAEELASEAVALAQAAGDDRLSAELYKELGLVHMQQLRLEAAVESFRMSLAHARKGDAMVEAVRCLVRLPLALYMLGRLDEAEQAIGEAFELSRSIPGDASLASSAQASLCVIRGDFAGAEQCVAQATTLLRRARNPYAGLPAFVSLACAEALRGNADAALGAIDGALEPGRFFDDPSPLLPLFEPNLRLIEAYAGRRVEAKPSPIAMAEIGEGQSMDYSLVAIIGIQVELAYMVDRPDLAHGAAPALTFADRSGMVFSIGWPLLVPRLLALLALMEGRRDEACQHFERAVRLADSIGALPEQGRARLDYAEVLARGGVEDTSRVSDLLRAALVPLRACGMKPFVQRAESLAKRLGLNLS